VLLDGTVGTADFEGVTVKPCSTSSSSAAGKGHGAALAASSNGRLLAVARQAAGAPDVTVDVYSISSSTSETDSNQPAAAALQLAHSCSVACPSDSSKLADVSLSNSVLAVQWKDGSITVYHSSTFGQRSSSSTAEHVATFPVPPGLSAAAAAAAAAAGQQSTRKRRAADDAAGSAAKLLCAAVSDTHLLLVGLQSPAEAQYAVLDSRYGCCLAAGALALEAGAATADNSTAQLLPLPHNAAAPAALLAFGKVHLLHMPLPKADLAGLVSRLGLAGTAQPKAAPAAAGTVVTLKQQLNLQSLAAAVSNSNPTATQQQQQCVLLELPGAQQQLHGNLAGSQAVAAAAEQLAAIVEQQPVPAAELQQVAQQLCTALQQQLQELNSPPQPARKMRHQQQQRQQQRQEGMQPQHGHAELLLVSQRLLGQGLAALADAQAWQLLGELHSLQSLQSLAACPRLLPALTAAQQYPLLRQVLLAAQDVPAESLVQSLQHLLAQPQQQEAAARQEEAAAMRAVAEAAVAAAEEAAAAGDAAAAPALLAMARKAAAAVDGFTASEVLLHVLLAAPVDAVEAQAALAALPTAAVLRLLKALHKWVAKYSSLPLRESPSWARWQAVGLDSEQFASSQAEALLLTPSWPQVLDWCRLVLDAHLTRLAMLPAAAPLLRGIQAALEPELGATSRLGRMKGVVDHMAAGGALPAVAEAANSAYTLELLDLRLTGRG
jgi:hypothetical protein